LLSRVVLKVVTNVSEERPEAEKGVFIRSSERLLSAYKEDFTQSGPEFVPNIT
jgi:hypothetical protein